MPSGFRGWPLVSMVCLASALLLAACGAQLASPAGASPSGSSSSLPGATTSPDPSPQATTSTSPTSGIYGLSSSGTIVELSVGQSIEVSIPGQPAGPWTSLRNSNPLVLRAVPTPIPLIFPVPLIGFYVAEAVGSSTLSSTMIPACRKQKPVCALPDRIFELTVVVTG